MKYPSLILLAPVVAGVLCLGRADGLFFATTSFAYTTTSVADDTSRVRRVTLPEVRVQADSQTQRLVPAGILRKSGPSTPPGWPPSAVWHKIPQPGGVYQLRAVEITLAKRPLCSPQEVVQDQQAFQEGRLRVRLLAAAADGTFALNDSLAGPLYITPDLSRRNQKGVVRLELPATRVMMPSAGVVVLLDVLPTHPNEVVVGNGRESKDYLVTIRQRLPNGEYRLRRTTECDYPALAELQNNDAAQCVSVVMLPRAPTPSARLLAQPVNRRIPNNLAVTLELRKL